MELLDTCTGPSGHPSRFHRILDDIEKRSWLYVVTLWMLAAAMATGLVVKGESFGNPYIVLLLAGVALAAERGRVELSAGLSQSVSLVPTLFAAVLFGPLAAMVVGAASVVLEFKSPYLRWASYTASRAVTAGLTGLIAQILLSAITTEIAAVGVATVAGATLSQVLDASFASVALRLRRRAGIGETLRAVVPLMLTAVPLYAPIVGFLAFTYDRISPVTLPLFLIPGLAAQRLFGLYQAERRTAQELVSANLSFATALVVTLDARDRYTAGHSAAVAVYARDIARHMGLSENEQQLAYITGLVHDIGKIGLSAAVLEKPGALDSEEWREMKRHSEIGERILSEVNTYVEIASIVRHHHERMDGDGYPDAIAGADIPLIARIIAVADAYNAMTSDRPYRDAMRPAVARQRLLQAADTQFDPAVIAAFEAILTDANESYRIANFDDRLAVLSRPVDMDAEAISRWTKTHVQYPVIARARSG